MGSEILTEVVTALKECNDMDLCMVSLMYSVATYAGNSVLNYNLDLLYPGYGKLGLLLRNFSKVLYRDLLGTLCY